MTSLRDIIRSPLLWGLVGASWLLVLIIAFFPPLIFVAVWFVYFALALTIIVSIAHIIEYISRPATEKDRVREIVRDRRWWIVVFAMWMIGLLGILYLGLLIALGLTVLVIAVQIAERLIRPTKPLKKPIRQ